MFANIVGSSRLYETMGDEIAKSLVTSTLKQLSDIVIEASGETVRIGGDSVLCRFNEADHAVTAADRMHEFLLDKTIPSPDHKISLRVGAHQGQVIHREGDIYGDAVNLAARVASLARRGKTLITGYTLDQLPKPSRKRCRHFTTTMVKGKARPIDVFDVVWEKSGELTDVVNEGPGKQQNELNLTLGDTILTLSVDKITSLSLGRSLDSDLVVASPHASRAHCRIECNRGKFILTDNSSNGTYVTRGEVELFFHQEPVPLLGEGMISLGATAATNPDFLIMYDVAPADGVRDETPG